VPKTSVITIHHGTNAGYMAHHRHKVMIDEEDSCGCREAHARYQAEQKQRNDGKTLDASRERELIRSRAFRRLARKYPSEFNEMIRLEAALRKQERGS